MTDYSYEIVIFCIFLLILAAPAAAADYSMFHADAARTGAALSAGPLTNTTLWVAGTAEWADGSPAVHDGKVFVPTWSDMNFTDNDPMGLTCYDALTSSELWTNDLGGQTVGSVSGVAVADGHVYLGGTDGKLYCIDEKTGSTLWSSDQIDGTGYFGLSSSPLVYEGNVYVLSASDGVLHEFETGGNETRSYVLGDNTSYFVSPAAADGKIYCSNKTTLFCIDPATQSEIWNASVQDVILSTPCVNNNTLFCAGAAGIHAFDRSTGEKLWNRTLAGTASSPATDGKSLYIGAKDGLHCFDVSTGNENWVFTSAQVTVSPVIVDGIVYFGTNEENGALYAANTSSGGEVWSHTLEAPGDGTWVAFYASSPAVSDGVLYIGAENNQFYAFGAGEQNTTTIWNGTVALSNTTFTFVPSNNASASYEIESTTDLGALDFAAQTGGFTFNASDAWYDSYGSFLLEDIDGIANEDWTQPNAKSWSIFINGSPAPAGLGANHLDDGDELTFYYCPTNATTYAPIPDEATYVIDIGINVSSGPTVIWDGTVALSNTTFTFVPSNNASASYEIDSTTDLGALDFAAQAGGFTFNASDAWYDSYGSFLLEDIDGIANEDWTQPNAKSWSIYVNGAQATGGLGTNNLDDGDELTFYYCPTNATTYAPITDEATYVVDIDVTTAEAVVGTPTLAGGVRGGFITAETNVSAETGGWYVVTVSGTDRNGDAIAGTGTVLLDAGETVRVPVIVTIPTQTATGTYTLYAGIYHLDDYASDPISHSGGSTCTVS